MAIKEAPELSLVMTLFRPEEKKKSPTSSPLGSQMWYSDASIFWRWSSNSCRFAGSRIMVWIGFQSGKGAHKWGPLATHTWDLKTPIWANKHWRPPNTGRGLGVGNSSVIISVWDNMPYNFFTETIRGRVVHGCSLTSQSSQPWLFFFNLWSPYRHYTSSSAPKQSNKIYNI